MSEKKEAVAKKSTREKQLTCGLVMPISALDGCLAEHWAEVKSIITQAVENIEEPTFQVRLVSDSDEVGVIQKRIVQNIYNSDIVVCDVSGKNPNVMFELGMRLAFDKPTVIVKDDKTDYSFDTGVIEHVTYPRDLRFARIVEFKEILAQKVWQTYRAALEDPEHSTFLKSFGQFRVAALAQTEVPMDKLVLDTLQQLQQEVALLQKQRIKPTIETTWLDANSSLKRQALFNAIVRCVGATPATQLSALSDDEEFVRNVEARVGRYFKDKIEFRNTLRRILLDLGAAGGLPITA